LAARIVAGEDVGLRPVMVRGPDTDDDSAEDFLLGAERVLVPELRLDGSSLFRTGGGGGEEDLVWWAM